MAATARRDTLTKVSTALFLAADTTLAVSGAADEWLQTCCDALEAGRAGRIQLWLPTAMTLAELAEQPTADAVLAARRDVTPLLPELVIADGAPWLKVPGDREYPL